MPGVLPLSETHLAGLPTVNNAPALGNCFKALPGTAAAKTLVSSQAAPRRAGHLTGTLR